MLKKICVAFDGSEPSYRAFDFALELCKLCPDTSPEITVLSVAVSPDIVEVDWEAIIETTKKYYERLHQGLKDKAKEQTTEIATEITIGHAAEQIIRFAADNRCDMVVVGQKGKSGIEGFFLGSVSRRVATHASCTVVIVR